MHSVYGLALDFFSPVNHITDAGKQITFALLFHPVLCIKYHDAYYLP